MVRPVARWAVALLLALAAFPALAQSAGARPAADVGLVFDMPSLMDHLQGYQGGLGVKLGYGNHAIRLGVNATYSSSTDAVAALVSAAYEYHFLRGNVSPYLGVSLGGGYEREATAVAVTPFSAGILGGAEVYVTPYLSLFAEYAVTLSVSVLAAPVVGLPSLTYIVGTGMGNDSMVGVVIHLLAEAPR